MGDQKKQKLNIPYLVFLLFLERSNCSLPNILVDYMTVTVRIEELNNEFVMGDIDFFSVHC